jgi:hypothetical protein
VNDDSLAHGRSAEWHLDFRKERREIGIGRYRGFGSDGRQVHSSSHSEPNDARPLARTLPPASRHPPPGVPPGGRTPLRRRPLVGVPRRGSDGNPAPLEGPDLQPADDPLGLPRPSAQRRPVLPRRRRPPDRASRRRGTAAVQLGHGRLLSGAGATARAVLRRRGPPRRAEPRRAGRPALALEGPPRLPLRPLDGLHARHAGEPTRVSPDLQPDARDELRPGADRGDHLAVVRGDPRPGHLSLRRQGPGGGQPAPADVGRAAPRRRAAGGPPDVGLGRDAPAEAARGRHCQPPVDTPPGRLPPGEAPGQGRPPRAVEEADVDPLGGPADVQRAARLDHGPRGPLPRGAARIPDPGRSSS